MFMYFIQGKVPENVYVIAQSSRKIINITIADEMDGIWKLCFAG
jgi:hypothetical protein